MQGLAIQRPMSVPVSALHRGGVGVGGFRAAVDDMSDGDDEFVGIEENEGDASGSSGEGPLGNCIGTGEKRKR